MKDIALFYDVLIGCSNNNDSGRKIYNVKDTAEYIVANKNVIITEEDGTPILRTQNHKIAFVNDLRYLEELKKELRKNEGYRPYKKYCTTQEEHNGT